MLLSGKNKSTTTHYYGNPGEYEISLTANAMCLSHEFVKTAVRIKSENLINVSLDCPKDIIELTANESCELSVLEGSGLNVAESGKFITTLPGESKTNNCRRIGGGGGNIHIFVFCVVNFF